MVLPQEPEGRITESEAQCMAAINDKRDDRPSKKKGDKGKGHDGGDAPLGHSLHVNFAVWLHGVTFP